MKTWTKTELKAVRKSAGITHAKLTTPNGKTSVVSFANLDTLAGVEGEIELGKMAKAAKKGEYFQAAKKLAEAPAAVEAKVESLTSGAPKAEKAAKQAAKPVESGSKAKAKVDKAAKRTGSEKPAKVERYAKGTAPAKAGTKFALVDSCVQDGSMTVLQIAEKIVETFPGTDLKTARHAVNVRCYRRKKHGLVVKLATNPKIEAKA